MRLLVLSVCAAACSLFAGAAQGAPAKPNFLIAVADDWSGGHAGAYGCRWTRTPAFDRIAQQGVLFTRAYTPNAKCAPSRAALLTGRNPWQLGAAANHICFFPAEFRSYPEALARHGYFVGMTQKGWAPGVATNVSGEARQMAGRPFNARKAAPAARGLSNNDYAGNFRDFLDAAPTNRPWCFWYGSSEPHRGYEYGAGVRKGGFRLSDVERVPGCWPDNEVVRNDLLDYAFEVEHFDRHLGRMVEALEERGQLGNTVVIVTSDNGMPFPHAKGQAYEHANHVPLAIQWPRGIRAPGRRSEVYVSLIDLAPTIVELAGLSWPETGMAPPTGRSLRAVLLAEGDGAANSKRDFVLIGKERNDVGRPHDQGYPIRGIVQEQMLYLRNFEPSRWPTGNPETGYLDCDGSPTKTEVLRTRGDPRLRRYWEASFGKRPGEELYDLRTDPDCLTNLAAQAQFKPVADRLQKTLLQELVAQEDPRALGKGEVFDAYPYANPGERGFYERFMRGESVKAGWVNETDFEKGGVD